MEKFFRELISKCCIKGEDSSNEVKSAVLCCVTAKEVNVDLRDRDDKCQEKEEESINRQNITRGILQLWRRRSTTKQSSQAAAPD